MERRSAPQEHGGAERDAKVEAIIARARSEDHPTSWNVWPLRRDRVTRAIADWTVISVIGFLIFIPAFLNMVPANFVDRNPAKVVFTLIVLMVLGVLAFGSLYLLISDAGRLRLLGHYLLIMTPDDFIKVEPGRVTHVPMHAIANITLKGVRVQDEHPVSQSELIQGMSGSRADRFLGSFSFRRRPREAPSLAFLDERTNRMVVVSRDNAFDELAALEQVLRMHVGTAQRTRPF